MPFAGLHREIARIALEVAARHGFVLGGGNALILHGLVERPTADVDLVTDRDSGVKAATEAVEDALRAAGYQVERQHRDADGLSEMFYGFDLGMAEWLVTSASDEQATLQITRLDRHRSPVVMDVGPVLALDDCLASKAAAAATRVAERDLVDLGAALARYSPAELIRMAQEVDPGLTLEEFADVGRRLDLMPDRLFTRYGLSPDDVAELRRRFQAWPRP